ncbi:MAG: hypothetical protein GY720_00970, partial [bacterium]|nr:hypothetical protein [bacterium]
MRTRPAGRPALAIALLAVSCLALVACGGRTEPSADSLVLLITADGDGHLDGLPLAIGGGRPLGGVVRLERAVNEERGYRPDALLVSAGGDVGDFADASVADTHQAVNDLGYQVLTPGKSELDVCGP